MMRCLITGSIVGFGGFRIHARVGSPFQPGAPHRRTNRVALIALILKTAGQFAQKVQ